MKEQRIKVEPFELLKLLTCKGTVRANEHGTMTIRGYIDNAKENEYVRLLTKNTWTTVKVYDENGNYGVLFSGIVTSGGISVENKVKILEITLKTGSFLMDLKTHIRSFQQAGTSYSRILDTLGYSYPGYGYIMESGRGKGTKGFLCQYKETDWQFARRIANICNTVLYPNYTGTGEKFYFGRPAGINRGKIRLTEYELKQTAKGITYVGKLRDMFEIGDKITLNGKNLYIIKRQTEYKMGELYHTYTLTEKPADAKKTYNDRLTGVSLDATVTDVNGSNVTVSIIQDENKASSGNKWFPYATVYSSPDGSGWYCMPEKGDCVRLYFPSDKENEAYVLSAAHLPSEDNKQRINPDNKSIMNKYGKEILFKPDSIIITNNNGMSLELSDADGISIISNKKIIFESNEAIEITSVEANIDLVSPENISLKQGNTSMVLSDKMVMKSTKVRLN